MERDEFWETVEMLLDDEQEVSFGDTLRPKATAEKICDLNNSIKNLCQVIIKQDAEIQDQEKRIKKLEEDMKLVGIGFPLLGSFGIK